MAEWKKVIVSGSRAELQDASGSFSGSFEGDGSGLTNVPASGVIGLSLDQIATTNVTASVSEGTDSFKLVSGSETPFRIDNGGITSGSFKGDGSGLTGVVYSNLTSVPNGIISASSFASNNQGEFTASFNGVATNLDLGLTSGDDVTFNQVTASSGVQVENSYNLSSPNVSSIVLSNVLGSFIQADNFIAGGNVLSEEDNSTIRRTVALGSDALKSGSGKLFDNTVIGYEAIQYVSESRGNTAIGRLAGTNSSLYLTSSNNTFIGYSASYTSDVSNATAIGYNTKVAQSDTVILGNQDDTSIKVGIGTNDLSAKLHIKGAGTTSGTTSLLVRNSDDADLLKVLDNGHITLSNVTGSSFTGSFAGSFTGVTDLPNLTAGNNGITSFTYDGSSTATVALNTAGSTFTDGVKAKLDTEGVFSSSIQVDHDATTNFVANEHIDHTSVSITAGDGMSGGGNIASSQTLTLDTGSTHFNDGVKAKLNTETVVSSSAQVDINSTSGTLTTLGTVTSGNVTDILPGGTISSSAQVDYDSISNVPNGIVSGSSQIEMGGDISGTADNATVIAIQGVELTSAEATQLANIDTVTITNEQWGYLGVLDQNVGVGRNVSFGDGTFTGDLTVQGTVTSLQTQDLNVEDQFILLNSGSTTGDSGLIFGGANGVAQQGPSLFWDSNYTGSVGRLAVTSSIAWNTTSIPDPDYHLAGVFAGTANAAATAKADHVGNIRVESGEIYIYA